MSAVMAQTGATFEESLGMLTAITEVTRNANKASRGLVSIGSRLNQVVDEGSTIGKQLISIYEGLGIELFDANGQLRSSYDIFSDLAKIWPTLDKNTKSYIASVQAGKYLPLQGELTGKPLELYLPNYYSDIITA